LVGESVFQWGNPCSRTMAFMRAYTGELVTRYRKSLAILGWEFSNEMNLVTDLSENYRPPVSVAGGTPLVRTAADRLTIADLEVAVGEFARTVRLYDSSRIIITGNAAPRPNAYHRYIGRSGTDLREPCISMLGLQNPVAVNTLSIHVYPYQEFRYFPDPRASLKEIIKTCMEASGQLHKPLFIGEFGAPSKLGIRQEHNKFDELLADIKDLKVPLAALWVFDYALQDSTWNVMPDNRRSYQLDAIGKLNEQLR